MSLSKTKNRYYKLTFLSIYLETAEVWKLSTYYLIFKDQRE